ncbi:hypothetical protein [Kingella potus]|nr:hypothetical protein [Kingella potus]
MRAMPIRCSMILRCCSACLAARAASSACLRCCSASFAHSGQPCV